MHFFPMLFLMPQCLNSFLKLHKSCPQIGKKNRLAKNNFVHFLILTQIHIPATSSLKAYHTVKEEKKNKGKCTSNAKSVASIMQPFHLEKAYSITSVFYRDKMRKETLNSIIFFKSQFWLRTNQDWRKQNRLNTVYRALLTDWNLTAIHNEVFDNK